MLIREVRDRSLSFFERHGLQQRKASRFGMVVAILAAGALVSANTAQAASPLNWEAPVHADASPPYAYSAAVTGVSCPSIGLCVAADGRGDVLTSTDPSGGPAAWTKDELQAGEGPGILSCPSTDFCAGADSGNVFTSTEPTGGAGAWAKTEADPGNSIRDLSCPSSNLCVAVGVSGSIATSTDPTGGADAWSVVHINTPNNHPIFTVSCPSTSLCVAGGEEGEIITATEPTGGAGAWTISDVVPADREIKDVSCPSESLCIATDDSGEILTSTDPTGGAGAWSAAAVAGTGGGRINCPAATFCAVTGSAAIFTSSNPTGGAADWAETPISLPNKYGGHESLEDVSCASESLCVLGESGSGLITSNDPTGGETAWSVIELEIGTNPLADVSCASIHLCAGVDEAGNVVTSIYPEGTHGPWTSAHIDSHKLTAVSCPSATFCAAVDGAGGVLTSTEPMGGAEAWTASNVDEEVPLLGISCASASLCVAIDREGYAVSSTDPTGGPSAWHLAQIASAGTLESISCPSVGLCIALAGEAPLVTTEPTGSAGTWTEVTFAAGQQISCPSTELCVAARFPETITASTNPTGAWMATQVEGLNGLEDVGCANDGLCVATSYAGSGSSAGNVVVSTNPIGGAGGWVEENVYGKPIVPPNPALHNYEPDLTGVSCVSEGMCVVTDLSGEAMIATVGSAPVAPANIHSPAISGTPSVGQTLSCSTGSWSGEPAPEISYRWLRDGTAITAATANTYSVQGTDQGYRIACQVIATNSAGFAKAISQAVQVPSVVGEEPVITTTPPISNAFKIVMAKAHGHGRIVLSLTAPGPGTFLASATTADVIPKASGGAKRQTRRGRGGSYDATRSDGRSEHRPRIDYGDGSATTSGTGATRLTIQPRQAASRALSDSGRGLRVHIAVTFTPTGGNPRVEHMLIVVHSH